MSGNPLFKIGAANPYEGAGRPKHSVRTVKGMVERFIKRNITPNKLQKMFNALTEKDKLNMLLELLPYTAPKQTTTGLSGEDVDQLYNRLMEAIEKSSKNSLTNMSTDELKAIESGLSKKAVWNETKTYDKVVNE